jgi:hypothetical protein
MAIDSRNPDASLVVVFSNLAVKNEAASTKAGRPMFDDVEHVTIRAPGMRSTVGVYPAMSFTDWVTDPNTGEQVKRTYAERFSHQYQQFKAKQHQTVQGTPLDFLPFLTEARRAELRALNVYTAEQLAGVDGQELKNLGLGGRDMKNSCMEYLANAKTNAGSAQAAAENEALRARLQIVEDDKAVLEQRLATAQLQSGSAGEGEFANMSDDQLREFITTKTGHAPQGSLSRKTLLRMAQDVRPSKAA